MCDMQSAHHFNLFKQAAEVINAWNKLPASAVAPTPRGTGRHVLPHFYGWARGHRE